MRKVIKRVIGFVEPRDVVALVSLASLIAGLWLIYPPAALIVPGCIGLAVVLWCSLPMRRSPHPPGGN